jgi:hypothetical protein
MCMWKARESACACVCVCVSVCVCMEILMLSLSLSVSLSFFLSHVIDGLHGKVEGHELADGSQTGHGGADGDTGKASLCDGCVDHTVTAELVHQPACHLPAAAAA